jgi:hypothetical protein
MAEGKYGSDVLNEQWREIKNQKNEADRVKDQNESTLRMVN